MYMLVLIFAAVMQTIGGSWAVEWPALVGPDKTPSADTIQLVFFSPLGGIENDQFVFDPSVFRGLTAAQISPPVRRATRFEIVREAGTFTCEGYFEGSRGTGTYVFHANPRFGEELRTLGLQGIDERQFVDMAKLDVGPRYFNVLRAAGLTVSTASQLLEMRMHGLTEAFIRDMREVYPSASPRDLLNMRAQSIRLEYVRAMREIFPSASIQDLINMKVQSIQPDYVREVRRLDPSASINDVVNMKVRGINVRR